MMRVADESAGRPGRGPHRRPPPRRSAASTRGWNYGEGLPCSPAVWGIKSGAENEKALRVVEALGSEEAMRGLLEAGVVGFPMLSAESQLGNVARGRVMLLEIATGRAAAAHAQRRPGCRVRSTGRGRTGRTRPGRSA